MALPPVAVLIGSLYDYNSWQYAGAGYLLLVAIYVGVVSYTKRSPNFYSAVQNRSAQAEIDEYNNRYSPLIRKMRIVYSAIFIAGSMVLASGVGMFLNGTFGLDITIIGLGLYLPTVFARMYSERLFKANVSEIDYIKGTVTCREIAVYWVAICIIVIYHALIPGGGPSWEVAKTLAQALGFVALAKILSAGYKEYKEALSRPTDIFAETKVSTGESDKPIAVETGTKNHDLKINPKNCTSEIWPIRVNPGSKLSSSQARIIRTVAAPEMTPGQQACRYPYNLEPYGRAHIPVAEGFIVVDGKILRTENGPLIEFWRRLSYGRELKVILPTAWVERISREESEWTDPNDIINGSGPRRIHGY